MLKLRNSSKLRNRTRAVPIAIQVFQYTKHLQLLKGSHVESCSDGVVPMAKRT